jgi:putative spermidine/putrescine transport system permease protein
MQTPVAPAIQPRMPVHRGARRAVPAGRIALQIVAVLFGVYMLLPIVLLLIGAFGKTWTNTMLPAGITGHWFADLAANSSLRRAFGVSLLVALACCCASAALGLPLAYALHYRSRGGRGVTARLIALSPIGVPALTLGFGYIAIFSGGSLPLLIAAHTVLTLPYLTQTLLSNLRHLDIERLEACAATLGASPLRQFLTVVLPNLRQSLFSGLVMVAALSIGEFQVSNLIAGFRYRNYPVVLLQAFYGATGMACAATVVLLCLAVIATLVSVNTVQRLK